MSVGRSVSVLSQSVCDGRWCLPSGDSTESLELVSHLEQPGYELEVIEQDENSNSQRAQLINNNVEIHPVRI